MSQFQGGRLPPLQAIGRSRKVDLGDEPPALDDDDIEHFIEHYDDNFHHIRPPAYRYEASHAGQAADSLMRMFKTLEPGQHVCKRYGSLANVSFTHCSQSVLLAQQCSQLQQLLEHRAQLELTKDLLARMDMLNNFVHQLEETVLQDQKTWRAICQASLERPPSTNLEGLGALLEELRVHMTHWNSLKQRIHTDPYLHRHRPRLMRQMKNMQWVLQDLRLRALWWLDRLVHIGLKVLAHCDLDRLSQDSLWSLTRGIEEFNTLVVIMHEDKANCPLPSPLDHNLASNIRDCLNPIPFNRVLHLLANERAQYAAAITQDFFVGHYAFLRIISRGQFPAFSWSDHSQCHIQPHVTTSDYHSGSAESHNSVVPDLSKEPSPLFDFARREKTFASRFLQIVSQSTSLLKKPFGSLQLHPIKAPAPAPPTKKDCTQLDLPQSSGEEALDRGDIKRKSVSWGDACEQTVISQLTIKYSESLWQHLAPNLLSFLCEPRWKTPGSRQLLETERVGSVLLCPIVIQQLLVSMMQQPCIKDIFPASAVTPLYTVSVRLHVSTAWTAWDQDFSHALASQTSDKCAPTPLATGEFCTQSGLFLHKAFHPLMSTLRVLDLNCSARSEGSSAGLGRSLSNGLLLPTMHRLLMTSLTSFKWCQMKSSQLLKRRFLDQFLLVSQSDLKILSDDIRHVLELTREVCTGPPPVKKPGSLSPSASYVQAELSSAWQALNSFHGSMQTLSGSCVKQFREQCYTDAQEFFSDAMSCGKEWRRKSPGGDEPSEYAAHAISVLLEPVVRASSHLKSTAQLGSISVAVTTMCNAWAEHILSNRIRFSLHGAQQLERDFSSIEEWLSDTVQPDAVKQSVLALESFRQMKGAVGLLRRQPRGVRDGRRSHHPLCSTDAHLASTPRCDISVSSVSDPYTADIEMSATTKSNGHSEDPIRTNGFHSDAEESEVKLRIPKKEQWLALRVQGGARSWPKLPSCLQQS